MVACSLLVLSLLGCRSFSAAGLQTAVDSLVEDLHAVATARQMPLDERHRRVVLARGNATDPFETVYHLDDRVSPVAREHLDLQSPVCVTEAGQGAQRCHLLSQRLCTSQSRRIPRTDDSLGMCFKRRKSCAVVGSSAHLLNASWGASIDGHDFVVRINGAPAGSADSKSEYFPLGGHVGTRTDARFVNSYGSVPDDVWSAPPTCIFLHEPMIPETCGNHCWEHPGTCNISCPEGVKQTRAEFCTIGRCDVSQLPCVPHKKKQQDRQWGHHVFLDNVHGGIVDNVVPHSTAGFKAVIYAMSICDSVSIFGFGPTCEGAVGHRYYESHTRVSRGYHHYDEELALLIRASEAGIRAIIPPEARTWITAKDATVALPSCVDKAEASMLSKAFQGFGGSMAVNFASEASFHAF